MLSSTKKVEDRQQLKLLSWQEVHISYFQGLLITSYEDKKCKVFLMESIVSLFETFYMSSVVPDVPFVTLAFL